MFRLLCLVLLVCTFPGDSSYKLPQSEFTVFSNVLAHHWDIKNKTENWKKIVEQTKFIDPAVRFTLKEYLKDSKAGDYRATVKATYDKLLDWANREVEMKTFITEYDNYKNVGKGSAGVQLYQKVFNRERSEYWEDEFKFKDGDYTICINVTNDLMILFMKATMVELAYVNEEKTEDLQKEAAVWKKRISDFITANDSNTLCQKPEETAPSAVATTPTSDSVIVIGLSAGLGVPLFIVLVVLTVIVGCKLRKETNKKKPFVSEKRKTSGTIEEKISNQLPSDAYVGGQIHDHIEGHDHNDQQTSINGTSPPETGSTSRKKTEPSTKINESETNHGDSGEQDTVPQNISTPEENTNPTNSKMEIAGALPEIISPPFDQNYKN